MKLSSNYNKYLPALYKARKQEARYYEFCKVIILISPQSLTKICFRTFISIEAETISFALSKTERSKDAK